jgi:hypothetical protein
VVTGARGASIGFSVHTGWAAAVTAGGSPRSPVVLDRRRVKLADSDDTLQAEVYHRAADMRVPEATKFLRLSRETVVERAYALIDPLRREHALLAVGIVTSAGKLPSDLAAILRSHPLVHTAEGVFYREAIAAAAEKCGLAVVCVPRRELADRFASALRADDAGARGWLDGAGRDLGPPWGRDQKDAAAAAVVALAEAGQKKVSASRKTTS